MMDTENLSRRNMLRGALVFGCGLSLPLLLSGCNSKKAAEPASAAPASPPTSTAEPAKPAAAKKLAQASVQYQPLPKGDQKCGSCVNFIAESGTCKLVDGQISPEGWCSLWAKKA
jgi:hypothetical protein